MRYEDIIKLRDEREKEMRTEEFKSKYTKILPYRVTFIAWREVDDPEEMFEIDYESYDDHKGRFVELEVPHTDWVGDNWDTPLIELAKKLTIDDLVESEFTF